MFAVIVVSYYSRATPTSIDQVVSDFDGVTFHISTLESKSKIRISMAIKCFKDLLQYGAHESLQKEYGDYVTDTEAGYDFSLLIDLDDLPQSQGEGNVSEDLEHADADDRGTR